MFTKFSDFNTLNEKKTDANDRKHAFGCLMLWFKNEPDLLWNDYQTQISDEDVYETENDFGREMDPHVTVAYGFRDDEMNVQDVIDDIKSMDEPVEVTITGIGFFEGDECDVLKLEVESVVLSDLNVMLRDKYPITSKFPTYIPHMTLAYVKPRCGKKYAETFTEPLILNSGTMMYSMQCGQVLRIEFADEE
jgi:2'-5' RNA ligase